jgi:hypothetical protein
MNWKRKILTVLTRILFLTIDGLYVLTDQPLVGSRILLILLFFNMLVCAYSGRVGWMLFWAIAFSSGVHEHGYEYGKTKHGSDESAVSRKF